MSRKALIWGGVGVLGAIATYYVVQQYQMVKNLCYKIGNVRIAGINPVRLSLDFTVTNKGKFKATVRSIRIKVYLNGNYAATLTSKRGAEILPNSDSVTPMELSFKLREVLGTVGGTLSNWQKATLGLKGNIVVSKLGLPMLIRIDENVPISSVMGGNKKSNC